MSRYALIMMTTAMLLSAVLPVEGARRVRHRRPVVNTPELQLTPDTMDFIVAPFDSLSMPAGHVFRPIPMSSYRPAVFEQYYVLDSLSIPQSLNPTSSMFPSVTRWLDDEYTRNMLLMNAKQTYMIAHPELIRYNVESLPEPPPMSRPVVDPRQHKFTIKPLATKDVNATVSSEIDMTRKNWIHSFDGALQFSQSYISPNWYQGGVGNINAIGNVQYNIKLNQAFHPDWLFEAGVSYKLAANNAPTDSLHQYNISEDMFRINAKLGYKAVKRWFYSLTVQFKTQLLNNYKQNTNTMTAAFLSPGELNVGLGMTYSHTNKAKTRTFDASLAPFSWNLKTCVSEFVDPASVGVPAGSKSINQFGSSAEGKFKWQMHKNITYTSRLYVFTDYDYVQGDWENAFQFDVTRFLSTKIHVHLRYDSSTTPAPDAKWRYWQLKEILSFGFSYKFSSNS